MESRLKEVALLFLRLGVTAFGGAAAHVAIMEQEIVRRRKWVTHERFLDLLSAASLIPGPSSSELAIYLGYERAGWRGLVVGGACFIAPAAILSALLAWAYVTYGALPQVGGLLYGVKPIVVAIVLHALAGLAPKAVKRSRRLALLGALALAAAAAGIDPLAVLVATGAANMLVRRAAFARDRAPAFVAWTAAFSAGSATAAPATLLALFGTFAKIGAIVFGSGYVLLAFLRADLVDRTHWLTESQLIDAVAVGQITPGPLFSTASFIGYLVAGTNGAIVSTIAIFLPGFLLVAATRPLVARVRSSPSAGAFLDGVNVASLAVMAHVTAQLARTALVDPTTMLMAVGGAVLLFRYAVGSTWLVLGSACVGMALQGLR